MRRAAIVFAIAMVAPGATLPAQRAPVAKTVKVAVRVVDSTNAPVAAADISVVRGVTDVAAHGVSNETGRALLVVPRQDGVLQLSVRKIGYQRGYRFFSVSADDSLLLVMRLANNVVALAPVTVTASEDLKRKSYHLDAEDIEKSGRTFMDAADVFKLRPDMRNARGGAKACEVPYTPRTGWIESVFVNGRRVNIAPVDQEYVHSRSLQLGFGEPQPRPNPRQFGRIAAPRISVDAHVDTVLSILRDIRAEHIAEVTYHDCFDMSVNKINSDLAMFIVLKPGIGYKPGIGSYVLPADTAHVIAINVDSLPRHRFRVLGIYDATSGDPVQGVDVIDVRSGDRVRSTPTGTVSLFFLPEGNNDVQLRRAGYRDTSFTVRISPSDTTPITAVLTRKPQ